MQAMKPIAGIQVPNENICEKLTPTVDNSSIPVSVRYTCMYESQRLAQLSQPYPQLCSCTYLLKVRLHVR